ncbi:MAG: signal transduction histidine kinase/CheY-like chemotaxis protein [bacterium]|jgi:signal transduction histidine kinase/CheY-like chemotaxis protein/HPt (histidine-containing phosphotransfer) domain-containing protein
MKEIKVKSSYLIVFVLIALLGFLLFIGTYSYTNISRVITDIETATISDEKLIKTKNLLSEISLAENSVKTYGLTKDTEYLDQYYESIGFADGIMNELIEENRQTVNSSVLDLELMDSLISRKFDILNSYLELQNDYRVGIALDKVIARIETKSTESNQEPTKERSFVKRLFNPNNKPQEKVKIDQIDTEIQAIKNQENRINKSIVAQELELIVKDKSITAEIDSILFEFEKAEAQRVAIRSDKAAKEIKKINQQITLLFLNAGLIVLFVILLIIRYVRTNNRFGVALKKSKERAEQLAETKERFLNNMSHEIRTPMNAIAGFIKQLSKSPLNVEQKEQVEIINKSADYLLHIVDEVLVFNKLQHNQSKIDKRAFDIRGLVQDLNYVLAPSAQKKGITLFTEVHKEVPKLLLGDPYKITQILLNVVGNALKFTTKGTVTVSVSQSFVYGKKNIVFKVLDTGIGMTPEQQSRIFQEFEQAEVSTTRQFGGTGLGLSITKKLVQLLKGTITVESEKGIGTTFNVTLPLEIGSESDVYVIRNDSEGQADITGLNILIVDDEVYNRKLLKAVLGKYEVNITEVENGIEAFEEVKRNKYDVVLMDTRMPVLDGVEATKKIRGYHEKPVAIIPIIAITAAISESDQARYKSVGMNGFLPKPFKESQLIHEIGRVTGAEISGPELSKGSTIKNDSNKLDFKHLKDLSNGDVDFFVDMLQTFCESLDKGMQSIKKSINEGNLDMVAEHAHRIAAPCKHLNAMGLYTPLKKIEKGLRSKELSLKDLKTVLTSIEKEAAQVLLVVRKKISTETF